MGKTIELPWSNMEHGGYEVMARVVVGCCWRVLLGSTVPIMVGIVALDGSKVGIVGTTAPRLVKRCRRMMIKF